MKDRQPVVHALLILGLVQIEAMELPTYAAVAATVEATRDLNQPRLTRLVNAVLRRWLREREELVPLLDADPVTSHSLPKWLIHAITTDWPDQADSILAASNIEPPLTLRVNSHHTTREALAAAFAQAGHGSEAHPWLPDALLLERSTDVTRLPGFHRGLFAVQDGAAQAAADLLDIADGQRVLDACAAPGGKACHLLERADVELVALERETHRARNIHDNLARLGLMATVKTGDASKPKPWWDGKPFDRILIDAPCSATGVIRRRTDVRLHRRKLDINKLSTTQGRILKGLWPLLAPGGRLLYVTCSLLRAENEAVINRFLERTKDASSVSVTLPAGHATGPGWQILPGEDDLDGMYFAVLEKAEG